MHASLSLLLPITGMANQSMPSFPCSPLTAPESFTTQLSVQLLGPNGFETYLLSLTRLQVEGLAVQLGRWGWLGWKALMCTLSGHEPPPSTHNQPLRQHPLQWLLHCEHLSTQTETMLVMLNFDLPAFGTGLAQGRHLFILQLFLGHLPGAEHCLRHWGPNGG